MTPPAGCLPRGLLAFVGSVLAFAGGGGTVVVKGRPLLAEVAVTAAELERGLMYRQGLAKDRCMLFLGTEDGLRPVRLRNHLIALDVAWVSADGRVVEMAERLPPRLPGTGGDGPAHGGQVASRHTVQFAAGSLRRLGLRKGDRIGWDLVLDDGTPVKGGVAGAPRSRRKDRK